MEGNRSSDNAINAKEEDAPVNQDVMKWISMHVDR